MKSGKKINGRLAEVFTKIGIATEIEETEVKNEAIKPKAKKPGRKKL